MLKTSHGTPSKCSGCMETCLSSWQMYTYKHLLRVLYLIVHPSDAISLVLEPHFKHSNDSHKIFTCCLSMKYLQAEIREERSENCCMKATHSVIGCFGGNQIGLPTARVMTRPHSVWSHKSKSLGLVRPFHLYGYKCSLIDRIFLWIPDVMATARRRPQRPTRQSSPTR